MDYLKISHVNRKSVSGTIMWLDYIHGNMHVTRGKRHEYLSMRVDYFNRGEVKISMEGYLREALDDFPEEITGRVKMPAATHLF